MCDAEHLLRRLVRRSVDLFMITVPGIISNYSMDVLRDAQHIRDQLMKIIKPYRIVIQRHVRSSLVRSAMHQLRLDPDPSQQ
jgi:hypothetical protein